ncbi:hypothetical protein FACS189472_15760 [Alphaproteobacteria bacterium]|nr:hypothetical protein FACS189472_15760 [Alphaproteobacteria bacterium]
MFDCLRRSNFINVWTEDDVHAANKTRKKKKNVIFQKMPSLKKNTEKRIAI